MRNGAGTWDQLLTVTQAKLTTKPGGASERKLPLAQIEPGQLSEELFHGQNRHRQLDQVCVFAGIGQAFLATIDHAQLHGHAPRFGVQIDTHHLATHPAFAQPFGKGATDQPQTDHHQGADQRSGKRFRIAHALSTLVSASRKRAFSSGKPMEMRKWVGMP